MGWTLARWLELAAWITVGGMGLVALTQGIGWTGWPPVFVLQATSWYSSLPAFPIALAAAFAGRPVLALVSAAVAASLLWLTAPVVFHADPPEPAAGDPRLTVLFANTLYENAETDAAARALLADDEIDVIGLAECTPAMETSLRELGIERRFPHRVGVTAADRDGMVLWSRIPFDAAEHREIGDVPGVDATLRVDGVPVRLLVVHPVAPMNQRDLRSWRRDLRTYRGLLDEIARRGERAVVVGDFNATRTHPDFRRLVDDTAFASAHELLGDGFSRSWPIDGIVPAFVRIDHALVHDVIPVATRDIDTPGSDHRAFVLTVALPRALR